MSSWLFVPENGPTQNNVSDGDRRSHATRFSHAQRREQRLQTLKGSLISFPKQSSRPVKADNASLGLPVDSRSALLLYGYRSWTSAPCTPQFLASLYKPPLRKGNSDPFSSLLIQVTPIVNQTLTFIREGALPSIYYHNRFMKRLHQAPGNLQHSTSDRSSWISGTVASKAWGVAVDALQDEGAALALIATYLSKMALLMSDRSRLNASQYSLILTTKSLMMLRKLLPDLNTDIECDPAMTRRLVTQVYYLFRASCTSGDEESIRIYGGMLKHLFKKGIEVGCIDIFMPYRAGVDDLEVSIKNMRRTQFDISWFGQITLPLWSLAESAIPPVPDSVFKDLHPNVEVQELRQAFIAARHVNAYAEWPVPSVAWGSNDQKHLVYSWFSTKCLWAISTAMNLFIDLKEDKHTQPRFSSGVRLTQAALAITLVLHGRSLGHTTSVNGVDLSDCTQELITYLRFTMAEILSLSTPGELEKYADAHLWVLFMGAFWEIRRPSLNGCWFQEHLVQKALAAKQATWIILQSTLKKFAYSDWDNPGGSSWFEIVVQEQSARHL